jgi:diguanylate cyclase (GGDEF)-like protein/PAS domain S-box-containing protein
VAANGKNRRRLILSLVLMVGLTASALVLTLQSLANNHQQAQLIVARIEADTMRLKGLQETVLALPQTVSQTGNEAVTVMGEVQEAFIRLVRLDDNRDDGFEELHAAFNRFQSDVMASLQLAKDGQVARARSLSAQENAQSYSEVKGQLDRVNAVLGTEARWTSRTAAWGSALIILLASAVMAYLFYHAEKNRWNVERLAMEQQALAASEAHFRSLVRNGWDVICVFDPDGTPRFASPAVERVLGYAPEAFLGMEVFGLIHPEDQQRTIQLYERALRSPGVNVGAELRMGHAGGTWRHVEVTVNKLTDTTGLLVTFHDISERKAFEAELIRLAFHDTLTDLPNRALFMDRLEQALARSRRSGGDTALLFLDLDQFKVVNDSLGHPAGDELIREVAGRLRECLGSGGTAARFGGDEFAVLLEEVSGEAAAVSVAERILAALRAPFTVSGEEFFTTASIGIALSSADTDDADNLLRAADLALYRAKNAGRNGCQLFDQSEGARADERFALENDLRRAVERQEFRVVYQPIVDLESGQATEMEALVRWDHPQRGWISPGEFIPLAEETGLIVPIGQMVLEEACRQAQRWLAEQPERAPGVNVNLSVRQLQAPGLVESVARTLAETGIDPARLKLEITESALMQESMGSLLQTLKGLGIKLALDDFGTGYCSLAYLRRFPIDILKIDRSFVQRLGQEPADTAIVQAIMTLARSLNLTVTGEGVETGEQAAALRALGCDRGQGYLFARPALPEDLAQAARVVMPRRSPQKLDNA